MVSVREVLAASQLDGDVTVHCDAGAGNEVAAVQLFEDLHDVAAAKSGALVVLTAAASREAVNYKLDMAIRRAALNQVAALVLVGASQTARIATSVSIAERAGVSVVSIASPGDLAELVRTLTAAVHADVEHDLELARVALEALDEARGRGADPEELVEVVGALLDRPVGVTAAPPEARRGVWDSVVVDGERQMVLQAETTGSEPTLTRLLVGQLARAVEQAILDARRSTEAPAASRSALLNELLLGDPEPSEQLLRRARRLGLATDDWYTSICIELDNLSQLVGNDEVARHHESLALARAAVGYVAGRDGIWHRAGFANSVLLVRADHERPARQQGQDVVAVAQHVLDSLRSERPEVTMFCGVGGGHLGFDGLRLSFAESRSGAARARLAGEAFRPYTYLGVGLRRLLLQWYSLEDAHDMIGRLLAPLAGLTEQQRAEALRTLRAYLDHAGVASKVAEELGVHRNTVAYRIAKLFELLDLDPADADHRLMLQLACRAVAP